MHLKFPTRLDNGISDYGVHERGNTISSCFDVRICISRISRIYFLFVHLLGSFKLATGVCDR